MSSSVIHYNEKLQLEINKYTCNAKKDDLCFNFSFDGCNLCNKCKYIYEIYDIFDITYQESINEKITRILTQLFDSIEQSEKNEKIKIVFKLFRIIICFPNFLFNHSKMCVSVVKKIKEFFNHRYTFSKINNYYTENHYDNYISLVYNYMNMIFKYFKHIDIDHYTLYTDDILPIYSKFCHEFYIDLIGNINTNNIYIYNNVMIYTKNIDYSIIDIYDNISI
jgi:hypothetical protein